MINDHLVNFMINKLDDLKMTISKADFYAENENLKKENEKLKKENEKLKEENENLKIQILELMAKNDNNRNDDNRNDDNQNDGKKIRHCIKRMNSTRFGIYKASNKKIISDIDNVEYFVSRFCINHYNDIGYKTNNGTEKKSVNGWDECEIETSPNEWKKLNDVIERD